MSKTKKFLAPFFALLFVFIGFLSVGCGKTNPPAPPEEDPPEEQSYSLSVNKNTFCSMEEIFVTATGDEDCWVGIYREQDIPQSDTTIKWYYVAQDGHVSGQTYALRHEPASDTQAGNSFKYLPANDYKIILFGDSGYTKELQSVKIKVTANELPKPLAPTSIKYTLKNATDGLAEGDVELTFPENSNATEVALYWANDNGILTNYTALAPYKVSKTNEVIKLYDRTLIPAEATKLRAYSKSTYQVSSTQFDALLSDGYVEATLPENCQYNFDGEALTEFQVVSDIHIATVQDYWIYGQMSDHTEHFDNMCKDIVANSPNSAGVFVVGDIANAGDRSEWELMNSIREQYDLPEFHFGVGNHDVTQTKFLTYEVMLRTYLDYAQVPAVYFDHEVGGYHHIFLGQEASGANAELSNAQITWFANRMKEITAADPDKPVFVYLHQSLYDTIAGGLPGQDWNGVNQDAEIRAILAKYKNIVMFNGHSHWDMNSYRNMYVKDDKLPNIFNTASVGYLWSSLYVPQGEYLKGSQGYYIKVYQDKILVLGRDFTTMQWIPSACYEASI